MTTKRFVSLVIVVLLIAVITVGTLYLYQQYVPLTSWTTEVPVLKLPVQTGDPIDEANIELKEYARVTLKEDTLVDVADVAGKLALRDLKHGELISTGVVSDAVQVPVPITSIAAGSPLYLTDFYTKPVPIGDVGKTTVLVSGDLDGRLAVTNLLAEKPVSRDSIDYPVEIWVPNHLIRAGALLSFEEHFKPVTLGARALPTGTLVLEEAKQIDGYLALVNLAGGEPVARTSVAPAAEVPVTLSLVGADQILNVEELDMQAVQASSVTTNTLYTTTQVIKENHETAAKKPLVPGQMLAKDAIAHKATVTAPAFVASRALPIYHILAAGDYRCNLPTPEGEPDPCAEVASPEGLILLNGLAAGSAIAPSDIALSTDLAQQPYAIELAVEDAGGLVGSLVRGNMVDVHATARQVFDVAGKPHTLDVTDLNLPTDGPLMEKAVVLGVTEGTVVLGASQATDVAAVARAAPRVQFVLVLRGDE